MNPFESGEHFPVVESSAVCEASAPVFNLVCVCDECMNKERHLNFFFEEN